MKPRHTAEQPTVRVNKAETIGKRGFWRLETKKVGGTVEEIISETPAQPVVSPIETPVMAETVMVEVQSRSRRICSIHS